MKLELFGEKPHYTSDADESDPAYQNKWSLGTHYNQQGFLTVDGTVEMPKQPYTRYYFDTLEELEIALAAAKIRGDAL